MNWEGETYRAKPDNDDDDDDDGDDDDDDYDDDDRLHYDVVPLLLKLFYLSLV